MARSYAWWWPVAVGVGLLVAASAWGGDGVILAGFATNVLAAPAMEIGLRRWKPADPRPWRCLQAAVVLLLLGNVVRGFGYDAALGPSDCIDMVGYVATATAFWKMGQARAYKRDPSNLIDALIAVGGFAVLEWIFLMVPYLGNGALTGAEKAAAVTFSLLTLAICTFTLRLAFGPGARNAAFYLLSAGALGSLGADIAISLGLSAQGEQQSWQLPVAFLMTVVAMIGVSGAAWHPTMRHIAVPANEPVPDMTARRLAMMTAAVLVAPGALMLQVATARGWTVPVVVACWILVSALVMCRLAGMVRARSRATQLDGVLAAVAEELLRSTDAELASTAERAALQLTRNLNIDAGMRAELIMSGAGDGSDLALDPAAERVLAAGHVSIESTRERSAEQRTTTALFPLVIGRRLGGVLRVPVGSAADDETLGALSRLARETALALERSRLIAETERRAGERRFKALVEHSKDVALQLDDDGTILYATAAARQVFGVSDEAMIGRTLASFVATDQVAALDRFLAATSSTRRSPSLELRITHAVRGPRWCELVATDLRAEPTVGGLVVTARTIDERKTAEQRLSRSEARFRSLVQHSSDVVAVVDSDFLVSYVSPSITRILGHHPDLLVDREFLVLVHRDDRAALLAVGRDLDPTGEEPSRLELRVRDGHDQWRTLDVTVSDLRTHPAVQGIVLNAHDVSERKELELDLARQATVDDLTGLANRLRFRHAVSDALGWRAGDPARQVAILFLDLNEFKTINDSMGHTAGDALLTIVARRIEQIVTATDLAARLGGDEFAMLVTAGDRAAALDAARRMQDVLCRPIALEDREITIAGSIGIAYADDPELSVGDLLRNADTAMYAAKRRGAGSRIAVFDSSMLVSVTERLELMNDLARVLERDELVLHYQPLIDLRTGHVKGFEALCRWQHPTRGIVGPGSFVPLAEEMGLIVPLTEWVLDEAVRQLAAWNRTRPGHELTMSVNLSGRHLEQDGAAATIATCLARHGVAPELLVVELTEGFALDVESHEVRRRISAITDLGVVLAADDFGSGFASYANLQRLPFGIVKIDRSVVDGLDRAHAPRARLQIRSIIEMAHGANMTVVAEGVEGAAQLDVLRLLGCDVGQGFYFARPVPHDQAEAMLFQVAAA